MLYYIILCFIIAWYFLLISNIISYNINANYFELYLSFQFYLMLINHIFISFNDMKSFKVIIKDYCTNIEEYCPEQYIILHELASEYDILRETMYSSILGQYPFYNIVPNISVCDNYISPYFVATCIQYNSTILFISRLLACKYRFTRNLSNT